MRPGEITGRKFCLLLFRALLRDFITVMAVADEAIPLKFETEFARHL